MGFFVQVLLGPHPPSRQLKPDSGMELFLVRLSLATTLVFAAPQRQPHIRAAAGYENVCKLSEQAYERGKAGGKSTNSRTNRSQNFLCGVFQRQNQWKRAGVQN